MFLFRLFLLFCGILSASLFFNGCAPKDSATTEGDADEIHAITDGDMEFDSDLSETNESLEADTESDKEETCVARCIKTNRERIDFGAITPGTIGEQDLLITSTGTSPVMLISIELDKRESSPFQIVSFEPEFNPETGLSLTPQESLRVRLQYMPAGFTDESDELVITTDADIWSMRRMKIPAHMQWKGHAALSVSPTSLDWGRQTADGEKRFKSFFIEAIPNELGTTTRPLWVRSISIEQTDAAFGVAFDVVCPDPQSEFIIDVAETNANNLRRECRIFYASTSGGGVEANLEIVAVGTADEMEQKATIALSAQGVLPEIELSHQTLDFGYIRYTETSATTIPLEVRNIGEGSLQIHSVVWALSHPAFRFEDPNGIIEDDEGILRGNPKSLLVAYEPSEENENDRAILRIDSNAQNFPSMEVTIEGNAVADCPPGFSSSESSARCDLECTLGEVFCWPNEGARGYRVCVGENTLGAVTPCESDGVCYDGECLSSNCLVGQSRCFGLYKMQHCNPETNEWGEIESCPTLSEQCRSSECRGENGDTACKIYDRDDGVVCDDGNPCTLGDACFEGVCTAGAGNRVCDDKNACTVDSCDASTGCVFDDTSLEGTECDDENPCTLDERCTNGECLSTTPMLCDDNNICTDDYCDPQSTPPCIFEPNQADCDLGYHCSENDYCSDGQCNRGNDIDCSDRDPCTHDYCTEDAGCLHTPSPGMSCDDGDPCTIGDVCLQSPGGRLACQSGTPVECDDNNPCTSDSCSSAFGGCMHENRPVNLPCEDGDPCTTGDRCTEDGLCLPTDDCDDGNICTDDYCNPASGCFHTANNAECDDGNPCTLNDRCANMRCAAGENEVDCHDDNHCTLDSCDPNECSGTDCAPSDYCKHRIANDGESCNADDNSCTDDRCSNGVCIQGESDFACPADTPCIHYACDEVNGGCTETYFPGEPCSDGNPCTAGDTCNANGRCLSGGEELQCDDGNPCLNWSCSPVNGCESTKRTGACDDENPCTTSSYCQNGECMAETMLDCDDENPCTVDSCDPTGQDEDPCIHAPRGGQFCDDGNPCTVGDICDASGICQSGTESFDCNDENPCTDDICNPERTGNPCEYTAKTGQTCDDENPCTSQDRCDEYGNCKGIGLNCDPEALCSGGACDPDCVRTTCDLELGECIPVNVNDIWCDDDNECTLEEKCSGGYCTDGFEKDCSDGNVCTIDSCDGVLGCQYEDVIYAPPDNLTECTTDHKECTMDVCVSGVCSHLGEPLNGTDCTDDFNQCTIDQCENGACVHTNKPNGTECNDDNERTYDDKCISGQCTGTPCECGPEVTHCCDGCSGRVGVLCDDENQCTYNDMCELDGECEGTRITCNDDSGICGANRSCNGTSECSVSYPGSSTSCNDGNACSTGDHCNGDGQCVAGVVNDECSPGQTTGCNECGTKTCNSDCTWGDCTGDGRIDTKSCSEFGCYGQQTRTCATDGYWSNWSACDAPVLILYDHYNYTGAQYVICKNECCRYYSSGCVGGFNDKTSSMKFIGVAGSQVSLLEGFCDEAPHTHYCTITIPSHVEGRVTVEISSLHTLNESDTPWARCGYLCGSGMNDCISGIAWP